MKKSKFTLDEANRFVETNKHKVNRKYRHHYHVMAPIGWINDPNGFVYFQDEYHLFFQYYPYDSQWGPMHWGHVKSKDLIHWEELPIALVPDQPYDKDGCFSGSAIEKDGKLYLMYTGHVEKENKTYQTQCIAISEDGIHFDKVAQNPVIDAKLLQGHGNIHDFRDPKVFQRENKYYSVVASKNELNHGQILLFESNDLISWSFTSILLEGDETQGIMWECPDLFYLDGKDVLIMSPIQIPKKGLSYHNVSSTVAFIGEVDWETGKFQVENYHEIDFGLDFYAPQTLEDDQHRRIMIAWMQMWHRTLPTHDLDHKWAGAMSLPRELRVKENRLVQKPISMVYTNLEYQYGFENVTVGQTPVYLRQVIHDNTYVHLVADLSQATSLDIQFAKNIHESLQLHYDVATEIFTLSREDVGYSITGTEKDVLVQRQVHVPLVNQQLVLEIFRDTSSIELFINALETMTMTFYEIEAGNDIVFSSEGNVTISSIEIGQVRETVNY